MYFKNNYAVFSATETTAHFLPPLCTRQAEINAFKQRKRGDSIRRMWTENRINFFPYMKNKLGFNQINFISRKLLPYVECCWTAWFPVRQHITPCPPLPWYSLQWTHQAQIHLFSFYYTTGFQLESQFRLTPFDKMNCTCRAGRMPGSLRQRSPKQPETSTENQLEIKPLSNTKTQTFFRLKRCQP